MKNPPKKLLDQVREAIRTKHYSYRTEQSYVDWIKRYILFHNKHHPLEMRNTQVRALTSASTPRACWAAYYVGPPLS